MNEIIIKNIFIKVYIILISSKGQITIIRQMAEKKIKLNIL